MRYSNTTKSFYSYEDIPLKVYIEIIKTGNIALVSKTICDIEDCFKVWESILERSSRVTGDFSYQTNIDLVKSFALFFNEYTTVKAMLIKLQYKVDDDDIAWLAERGYVIKTAKFSSYVNTLVSVSKQSDNLRTKIASKHKEILKPMLDNKHNESISFQQVIANLSAKLQFPVPETITLAAYNEYLRIIKSRTKLWQT